MPLDRVRCDGDGCTETRSECPECESYKVTPREEIGKDTPNHVVDFGGEGEFEWEHVCWNCGWTEVVSVKVSRS